MKLYKIKKSNIDNKGLYAAKNIKAGKKIIYYKGKIITKKETERNPKYDNDKAIYLFNLTATARFLTVRTSCTMVCSIPFALLAAALVLLHFQIEIICSSIAFMISRCFKYIFFDMILFLLRVCNEALPPV